MSAKVTDQHHEQRASAEWRALAALITLLTTVGVSTAFLFVAWLGSADNCEDGCPPESRGAPGAWGSTVELWALALPAFLAACALVWAVGAGRARAALFTWALNAVLLVAWCVFTGVSAVNIDFSGTKSHWLWLARLFIASGGGLIGVAPSLFTPPA